MEIPLGSTVELKVLCGCSVEWQAVHTAVGTRDLLPAPLSLSCSVLLLLINECWV